MGDVFQAMGKDRVAKMFLFVGALIQKALKVILLWVKRIEHRFRIAASPYYDQFLFHSCIAPIPLASF